MYELNVYAELHELYRLKSIVNFLSVFAVSSYTKNLKGFKKGYGIYFTVFENTTHFHSLLWAM